MEINKNALIPIEKIFFRNDIIRTDIINSLIKKHGFKSYLEIGVFDGSNFDSIECESKTSVDPEQWGSTTHVMTSDEFFAAISNDQKWDIIFIDGLHEYHQCYRDIINSTKYLNPGGFIICHDMNPLQKCNVISYDEYKAITDSGLYNSYSWNGDVYKAFIKFRKEHVDWSTCMLYDCDWGIGVITKGIGQKIECDVDNLTFDEFTLNKGYLMNCIPVDEFLNLFCK